MTRRERHERILNWFDRSSIRYAKEGLESRHGLSLYTDEAIAMLAADVVANHRFEQKLNKRNRELNKVAS